jgi:hypothetical protein
MSDIASGFPRNLSYNLKKLDAGFSKTKVRIIPDNQTVAPNGIVRFRITGNGLYDLRSLCMYMTGACSTTTADGTVHFPRYAASMIENISITANNTTLCSINGYNMLYNKLMDIEGSDISQYSKRMASGERYDPSIKITIATTGATEPLTVVSNVLGATASDSGERLVVNNWLGILGSCSTPVIDLGDIGDLYINIQFAPTNVLWQSVDDADTAIKTLAGLTYSLTDVYMTIDRCSFQDPLYYNLKTEKLLSPEGLNVAYYDYFTAYGSLVDRSTVSMNFNINSASLDQVIVMLRPELYNDSICRPLILHGSTDVETTKRTFSEVIANPALFDGLGTASITVPTGFTNFGDAYNQVFYFVSNADNLSGSRFSINSVDIDPYSLPPIEIFNKVLQYTGFQNIDLGTSGLHPGIMSVPHFLKYYFVDICDLTNISGDNQFWISGIDGRGGGINVQYNASFTGTNTGVKVLPLAYCRSTKVLRINGGRQLTIDSPSM